MKHILLKKQPQATQLTYEFTRNQEYLKQYANLVVQYYKKDLNLDLVAQDLYFQLTDCQENEYIYIVREGDYVIGGTKLSFSSTGKNQFLPMEDKNFTVSSYLPATYDADFYGEIGRLVIDPEYRGKDILHNMVASLMQFSLAHHCGYLFVLAPRLNAVLYRRLCKQLNTPAYIHKDANLPDKAMYRELNLQLLSCDLQPFKENSQPELIAC